MASRERRPGVQKYRKSSVSHVDWNNVNVAKSFTDFDQFIKQAAAK